MVANVESDEGIVNEHQPFSQWRSDVVEEFKRSRPRAAFGAVNNDEIRIDAGFQHGLANAEELPRVTDAEFESDRLPER